MCLISGIDNLQTEDINKEETKAYELDDDVNDDQAPKEEESITEVTFNVDNQFKPSSTSSISLKPSSGATSRSI